MTHPIPSSSSSSFSLPYSLFLLLLLSSLFPLPPSPLPPPPLFPIPSSSSSSPPAHVQCCSDFNGSVGGVHSCQQLVSNSSHFLPNTSQPLIHTLPPSSLIHNLSASAAMIDSTGLRALVEGTRPAFERYLQQIVLDTTILVIGLIVTTPSSSSLPLSHFLRLVM